MIYTHSSTAFLVFIRANKYENHRSTKLFKLYKFKLTHCFNFQNSIIPK